MSIINLLIFPLTDQKEGRRKGNFSSEVSRLTLPTAEELLPDGKSELTIGNDV